MRERGNANMKRNKFVQAGKRFLAAFLAVGMLVQPLAGDVALASDIKGKYEASFIEKLENLFNVDNSAHYDSSAMFKLPDTVKADDEISVIVTVDTATIMDAYEQTNKLMSYKDFALTSDDASAIKEDISAKKADVLADLDELGVEYTTGEEYNTVLSGFEISIQAKDFEKVCKSLDKDYDVIVGEEYKPADAKLVENLVDVYEETGIFDSSNSGYDGSGMTVAVLDTGVDSNHSAFDTDNFTSDNLGLTYDEVAAILGETVAAEWYEGLSVDDVYINEKIPFGFDYADKDPDVYATHNNHGNHVSGIIVGNDDTITGVAPNAQLISMKIFSDVMDTSRTACILAALEDCVTLGVDVINMSLGTSCGFSRESDEEKLNGVYDKLREAGINMIVAASNSYNSAYGSEANGNLGLTSNPDTGTVGSPSTYEGVMSVASISGTKTPYLLYGDKIIYFLESTDGASEENHFVDTMLGDGEAMESEFVVIPGVGRTADYTGIDVEGKIVLVRRGGNTFEEKAIIAEEQGATGLIIYNNVSGDIKMNVGDAKIAVCSISQDDGEMLAATGGGKIKISKKQTAGPFISDFSSWGPTPDLRIKPEITAHGGNILSALVGGGYERISGTSMACPNLAGMVVLLRQYVKENFPDIADDNVAVTALIYQLIMSTADIAYGQNGLPYSVRKQGAGLANITNAIGTHAYLTTKDAEGKVMDKAKIELGDDPEKNGVYELTFTINNIGDKALTYDIGAYVMTEGVSETKTAAGKTTVTEESYILDGATITVDKVEGGTLKDKKVTVKGGENAEVTVTITLSDADKQYLDDSFENGMYVEGFITLTATKGTKINLSLPYLAFYGDWTEAPLFDKDYFETDEDEKDESLELADKNLPDAYSTRPIGTVEGDYIGYLGSYYFIQDKNDIYIPANREHVSLSNQDGAIHELAYVWAGLLRNAERVDVSITDDATGEVIFETSSEDVRKSYSDGGPSIFPSNVKIHFNTQDYNLKNNSQYTVSLKGYMDYEDDGSADNLNNTFEFPLTMDFEAPTVTDVKYSYEYDKTLKKNRLYAEVAVYDNHYAMAGQLGYVAMGEDEDGNPVTEMKSFERNMTPIYSERNGTTYVKFELTDYLSEIMKNSLNKNSFALTVYDYALNYATYDIGLPDDYTDFYLDGLSEGLTMSPNEVYTLEPLVYPETEWAEMLEIASSKPSVVRVVNNKLVAVSSGKAIIRVQDPKTHKSQMFEVNVLKEGDEGFRRFDKPVADVFALKGYYTQKAYYILDTNKREIGDQGSQNFFEGDFNLGMYPSESVYLNYALDAFFPDDVDITYESSNDSIVKVDESGLVTAVQEGFASVTIKIMQDGKSTYYSETVSVEVKDPFITSGPFLTQYYGNGGLVTIPDDRHLTEIGAFAFSNYKYVDKTPEEIELDDSSLSKQWYIGENTITKVVIPEGVKKINQYAFANLTALEEVVLPSTLQSIEYGAFLGCTSLKKVTFSGENNLKIINQEAFKECALDGTLDLSSATIISDYAFAGNKKLDEVVTSENLLSIGSYAFAGCSELAKIDITAEKVKYGSYAFNGCKKLSEFYVNAAVLPEGMFYECTNMNKVTIGPDVNAIGEFAFRDTAISEFVVKEGNSAYKAQSGNYILSADGKKLAAVAPTVSGEFTSANIGGIAVTEVADGAFSHNRAITSIVLENVTKVGDYAFASNEKLTGVKLGALTDIGEYAFFETAITELPAFTAETEIGKYAFAFTDITSVTVPDKMVIAEGVFSENDKLTDVVIGNDVTLGLYAFGMNKDNIFEIKNYENEAGKKMFYYEFKTALANVTIGDNAKIGERAFTNAACLEKVTLGANAEIGKMAFYNNNALKEIDLSKAISIGDYAFSGDSYNVAQDENMQVAAVSKEGQYIFTYYGPDLTNIDLSAAESIGEYAFASCRELQNVVLGEKVTELPQYAFAGTIALQNINLGNVTKVGDYAFMESGLVKADLSKATEIGEYAFVNNTKLTDVTMNAEGTDMAEGAFAYASALTGVTNLNAAKNIGSYAFAHSALASADVSGAETIEDFAFMKDEPTPFTVVLGEQIKSVGDNPFANCQIGTFKLVEKKDFNGVEYTKDIYDYEISNTVKVVDGSLYSKVENGWELIAYGGLNVEDVQVMEDTVRITSMAFEGSKVQMVTLPHTVAAVGHKAFFGCNDLKMVVFGSYEAPVMEEELDTAYYESYAHIPGAGDYGNYIDYEGNEVAITGEGIVPYYMWTALNGLYSNVLYGANFVDYVGYVEDKLLMVRPENGVYYDSYIMNQYFDLVVDGATAPDDITMAAIKAIKAIPEKVAYEDRALVEAARAAYDKIATTAQQALVTNYADLVSAEQRIISLTPEEDEQTDDTPKSAFNLIGLLVIVVIALAVCAGAYAASRNENFFQNLLAKLRKKTDEEVIENEESAETAENADEAEEVEDDDEVEVEFYEVEPEEVDEDETEN